MNDDTYPPEWLDGAPPPWDASDELDPYHPDFLRSWYPTSAEQAAVEELVKLYVRRDPRFNVAFLNFGRDHYKCKSWPQAMLALIRVFDETAVGAQGVQLTLARIAEDIRVANDEALEGMQ